MQLSLYRYRGEDKTLENHPQNAPRNTKKTSPDIQYELIKCCRDFIVEQLVGEAKENRFYSILLDWAPDYSLKKQVILFFWFANKKKQN